MTKHSQKLREIIAGQKLARIMAAHNPLSAILAREAGFDGVWASGFEFSASLGLPDVSLVSMSEHVAMVRAMATRADVPIVADIDTGYGNAINVLYAIAQYEEAGASAIVIEDKTFPKVTSLIAGGRQDLLRIEEFQGKIEAALHARSDPDFLIIARTEALIADLGQDEALGRAQKYADAGADMVLIHSKSKTREEIEAFASAWSGRVPLAIVPTTYPDMSEERALETGKIKMIIYGNHAIRASVSAMQDAFGKIIADGGTLAVEDQIAPVTEIFRLQQMSEVKANEKRFLR